MNELSLTIKRTDDLKKRAFISIYLDGKRIKEYTRVKLGMNIKPNSANSIYERDRLLSLLEYEFRKAIDIGNYPIRPSLIQADNIKENISIEIAFKNVLNNKLNSNLSPLYKRNLKRIYDSFVSFMGATRLAKDLSSLKVQDLQGFLSQFQSPST